MNIYPSFSQPPSTAHKVSFGVSRAVATRDARLKREKIQSRIDEVKAALQQSQNRTQKDTISLAEHTAKEVRVDASREMRTSTLALKNLQHAPENLTRELEKLQEEYKTANEAYYKAWQDEV